MKKPIKFLFWPYSKKKLLVHAFLSVATIRLSLWLFPFKRVNGWLSGDEVMKGERRFDWDQIREIAAVVRFCSRFVPQATCLTQALAARWLLQRVGQCSLLKIGVEKDENLKLCAHAWVEIEGKIVIGKVRNIRRYSIMSQHQEQLV